MLPGLQMRASVLERLDEIREILLKQNRRLTSERYYRKNCGTAFFRGASMLKIFGYAHGALPFRLPAGKLPINIIGSGEYKDGMPSLV